MKYICSICGYVYDETSEGTAFTDLPDSWVCPLCRAAKDLFRPEKTEAAPEPARPDHAAAGPSAHVDTDHAGEDLHKLSAGELSALCSNLARGCEKQYKNEEAGLFREIAAYFAAVTPDEPDGDLTHLLSLFENDLTTGYPAVQSAAQTTGDRGTQRVCVWGQKVTVILNSLVQRYQREGSAFLRNTQIWVCSVCGFAYVGDTPPELCPVCKVPAWKFDKIEGRRSA